MLSRRLRFRRLDAPLLLLLAVGGGVNRLDLLLLFPVNLIDFLIYRPLSSLELTIEKGYAEGIELLS